MRLLKGSFSLKKIADRKEDLLAEYENICKYLPDFKQYTYKEFVWARLAVITRIFGLVINGNKTDGLVPMADMLNHKRPRGMIMIMIMIMIHTRALTRHRYPHRYPPPPPERPASSLLVFLVWIRFWLGSFRFTTLYLCQTAKETTTLPLVCTSAFRVCFGDVFAWFDLSDDRMRPPLIHSYERTRSTAQPLAFCRAALSLTFGIRSGVESTHSYVPGRAQPSQPSQRLSNSTDTTACTPLASRLHHTSAHQTVRSYECMRARCTASALHPPKHSSPHSSTARWLGGGRARLFALFECRGGRIRFSCSYPPATPTRRVSCSVCLTFCVWWGCVVLNNRDVVDVR